MTESKLIFVIEMGPGMNLNVFFTKQHIPSSEIFIKYVSLILA